MPASVPTRSSRALVAALGLTIAACAAPSTRAPDTGAGALRAAVDSATLLGDLSALAADSMEGRLAGSPGGARARALIVRRFQEIGLAPLFDSLVQPVEVDAASRGRMGPGTVANVVGVVRGTARPERYVVLTAHYDHVGIGRAVAGDSIYNGADDNASGAAALVAIARDLLRGPPAASVVIAALDAEERGMFGARGLVRALQGRDVVLNVNLDMISHSERGELYAAGASHRRYLAPYLDTIAARSSVRLIQGHDRPIPNPTADWTTQSDHRLFHEAGIPFVYFGVEDHPDYHRPSDETDSITPGFYVRAVATVLDAVRTFATNADALAAARATGR